MTETKNKYSRRPVKKKMDMTEGPLFGKIIRYSIPLILTGILSLLYNAVDLIVVGRYSGTDALAAVGATGSLNALMINVFLGISTGAGVVAAQHFGAKEDSEVSKVLHTSVIAAFFGGLLLMVIGELFSGNFLAMMGTPDEILPLSSQYMKIIFLGVPGNLIYNYCASVLRASGDTKRPLIFLSISGVANVFLNLLLVIVFHMGVSGVAVATIMSQYLSATLMLLYLSKQEGALRFSFKLLRFDMKKFNRILAIGIPCGIQGSLFSISNVLIQSSVNSFGAVTMAGNSAAANIEGFIYTAMNAIHHTSMNFTGQNVGARKYDRLMKVLFTCLVVVLAVWVLVGGSLLLFREPLLALYVDRNEANFSEVIAVGCERMAVVGATYFLCGILEVVTGSLRGMGKTLLPSIIQLIGACGFRIFWIYTVFKHWNSLTTLLISYPVSWILTATPLFIMCFTVKREFVRRDRESHRVTQ